MIKFVIIILLIFPCVCTSQVKITSKIKKDLRKIGIDFKNYEKVKSIEIENYNEGFTVLNSNDSIELKEILLDNEISLFTYKFIPSDYKQFHQDFFRVKDMNYNIDSIIKYQGIELKYYNPYFYMNKYTSYKEKNKNNNLIIIEAINRTFYKNKEVKSLFIIRIYQKNTLFNVLYDY